MNKVSVVIAARNEAQNLSVCLPALRGLTEDVLIIENQSTDDTVTVAQHLGARVISTEWKGYSATKNWGIAQASYDWIFSLDADEEADEVLIDSIRELFLHEPDKHCVFAVQRKMVYGQQVLHHGAVAKEYRVRLFHRETAIWDDHEVHEELFYSVPVKVIKLKGCLWHHSYTSEREHQERLSKYARLSAQQMKASGKRIAFWKPMCSPAFHFVKNYFFRLGFLDGKMGYRFARNEMRYVQQKYQMLKALD
jgi:glycosyltransferase involved in cell wall biosynthesis